jgi:SAM-dependent methyltransferase
LKFLTSPFEKLRPTETAVPAPSSESVEAPHSAVEAWDLPTAAEFCSRVLDPHEVSDGYRALVELYPLVPPLSLWRAWELAVYRHFKLDGRVIDIGCGDGRYFRHVWPGVTDVVGVDMSPGVAETARATGVYKEVLVAPAHDLPFDDQRFESAFANCSLEHMDRLDDVLASVFRVLRPGGRFLLSVVTDRFLEWSMLPGLAGVLAGPEAAADTSTAYLRYHHLVSAFTPSEWKSRLARAGFEVAVHVPVLPELTSRLFLFMDQVWHVSEASMEGEVGDRLVPFFARFPNFAQGLLQVFEGILQMERDLTVGSGAIFHARRPA